MSLPYVVVLRHNNQEQNLPEQRQSTSRDLGDKHNGGRLLPPPTASTLSWESHLVGQL